MVPSGRTPGKFRLYSDEDIERLSLIKRMKPLGFSIDEMRELLALRDRLAATPADAAERVTLLVMHVGRIIDRIGVRWAMIGGGVIFGLICVGMSTVNSMVAIVVGFAALRVLGPGALSLSGTILPTGWPCFASRS